MKFNARLFLFTIILVILATACKYFFGPDLAWSGFSPVIAIALFSGFMVRQRNMAFILPLLALFVSDLAIQLLYKTNQFPYPGLYDGQWKNYLLLLSATLIGWAFRGRSFAGLAFSGLIAPTVYFLISNFMVWQVTSEAVYANNFGGLMKCYVAALPFYRNSLIATFVFLPLILGAYNVIVERRAKLVVA